MMKQIHVLTMFVLLAFTLIIFTGCSSNNGTVNGSTTTDATVSATTDTTAATISTTEFIPTVQDIVDWKTAYKNYLASYTLEMGFITLGLADFNNDTQPELIIIDDSKGTLRGVYTIVSYQNGEAVKLGRYGTTSSVVEVDGHLYFYRNFDSILASGGMYGYGFVSKLTCEKDVFSVSDLLRANIDHSFDYYSDEKFSKLNLDGEVEILTNNQFREHLIIQQRVGNVNWQNIEADEYLSMKGMYIGAKPIGKDITDYFDYTLNFFDEFGNTYPITQSKLDEFCGKWDK